jgi:hypothetical protein
MVAYLGSEHRVACLNRGIGGGLLSGDEPVADPALCEFSGTAAEQVNLSTGTPTYLVAGSLGSVRGISAAPAASPSAPPTTHGATRRLPAAWLPIDRSASRALTPTPPG